MSKKLLVLGPGCARCNELADAVRQTAVELGLDFELEKVTEIEAIMDFGVMMTPALVVDGDVKVVGRVPSDEELRHMLS